MGEFPPLWTCSFIYSRRISVYGCDPVERDGDHAFSVKAVEK